MKSTDILIFILFLGLYTCGRPAEGTKHTPISKTLSATDTVRLRAEADSLITLAKDKGTPQETKASLIKKALNNYRQLGAKEQWVQSLILFWQKLRSTNPEAIVDVLNQAIQDAWWEEDHLKGRIYLLQGLTLRKCGRNYAAQAFLEKAKTLSDQYGNVSFENPAGGIYKTLAGVKTRLGDYEGAIKILREALVLLNRDTNTSAWAENQITKAEIFIELGIAHHSQENPAKAMEQYTQGLAVLDAMKTVPADLKSDWNNTRGVLLTNTAGIHLEANRNPVAEEAVKAALRHIDSDRPNYLFNAYNLLAEVYANAHRDDLAQASWKNALVIADTGGAEKRELAKLLNRIGWAAFEKNRYDESIKYAQLALHTLYPTVDSSDYRQNPQSDLIDPSPENAVAEALDLKGEALYEMFKNKSDIRYLNVADSTTVLAIEMMENLRDVVEYESSKLRSSSESRRLFGRMMRILNAAQESGSPNIPERALAFAEKSNAVLLHQKIEADAARKAAGVPDSLIAQEHDLEDQWVNLKNQLFEYQMGGNKANDSISNGINRRIFKIEDRLKRVQSQITSLSRQPDSDPGRRVATLGDIQKHLLRDNELWVEYFTDPDSSLVYLIAIDKNSARFLQRPYAEVELRNFIDMINDESLAENRSGDPATRSDFVRRSRLLYENLLLPALSGPIPERLTIAPDGALALLPFDVLLYESPASAAPQDDYAGLPFLIGRCQTRLVPSASLELFFKETPRARPKTSYVGFAPDYSGSVLRQVKSGAKAVKDAAAAFKGRSFTGPNARADTFLLYAPGCAIVHFHGHAEASDSFPDYSWLAFSPGIQRIASAGEKAAPEASTLSPSGRLPAEEYANCLFTHKIYHSQFDADLVLLSACQTGLGKIAPGEGTLSLSRAFQAAGCPATLMSLWKVRDDATAALMQAFLENIRRGQDKDEALANAKRHYLQSNGAGGYPYFWAGFVLTGTADPVRLPESVWAKIARMALAAGAAAAVFAAVLFFARRRAKTTRL